MSKIPASGFKSPAPVLPAMGLHSFHNDSPPFAPASQHAKGEPEHLSLDLTPSPNSPSNPNEPQPSEHDPVSHDNPLVQPIPVPIRQKGFELSAGQEDRGRSEGQVKRPIHSRLPTSSADDALSTSRSRRLLSGYMFGNPPSPTGSQSGSPTKNSTLETLLQDGKKEQEVEDGEEKIEGYANPPPPSQTRDSTPISTVSSSPEQYPRPDSIPVPPLTNVVPNDQMDVQMSSSAGTVNEKIKAQDKEKDKERVVNEELRRRRMSRVRDKEIGYDALTGLSDGEADADDNAPQAVFGSRQYLMGAKGEAGEYRFPRHRLRTRMKDESKIPLVIVACGSFSPPTYLHLRMFEMAKDEVNESQTYEIMAGYYSPVSSYYKKAGLAPAIHRVRMCELAVEHTSTWLMVDPWEAGQPEYTRTAVVLEHFNEMLNVQGGGLTMSEGKRRKYKIMLLAGGDLIESFGEPGVWSEPDLHIILGRFGCLIVERAGSDVWAFLLSHDILYDHRRNVIVIKQLIYNDISSTKVRLFVKRGMSIKYLLPNSVIQYIYDNKLYR